MTLGLFSILKGSHFSEWIFYETFIILIRFGILQLIKNSLPKKRKGKMNQKIWLFEEIINQYGFSAAIVPN
jgi:hypothetical protein